MSLKALPNILKLLKIDMIEIANSSQYSLCLSEAFELLNNLKLTLDPNSVNYLCDVYKFKNNIGTMEFQVHTLNTVHIFMKRMNNPENLKKTMIELSKTLKWISPLIYVDGKYLSTDTYPNLQCYTVTNKESLNLIKLALMKARIKFEVSSKYIIGKDCAFMAFKNEANEIKLIFDAN